MKLVSHDRVNDCERKKASVKHMSKQITAARPSIIQSLSNTPPAAALLQLLSLPPTPFDRWDEALSRGPTLLCSLCQGDGEGLSALTPPFFFYPPPPLKMAWEREVRPGGQSCYSGLNKAELLAWWRTGCFSENAEAEWNTDISQMKTMPDFMVMDRACSVWH